jgi:YggT family protein
MITISPALMVENLLTLYMLLILLRWTGPWLELDLQSSRLKWIPAVTDPLIRRLRALLPPMGAFDFAPLAALFAVLVLRIILVGFVSGMARA